MQIVSDCCIQFIDDVPYNSEVPKELPFSNNERSIIDKKIREMLNSGIISQTKHSRYEFISKIFIRPKRSGGHRLILDLSKLNDYIQYEHFKMETFTSTLKLIDRNAYMASVDLKDAYYTVSMNNNVRKLLRFTWNGMLYQFNCLPNGLACAPRLFTKLMKPVFAHLRSRGFLSAYYLDDSLLVGHNYEECLKNVEVTCELMKRLGFTLNYKKSLLIPSQQIEYLGFIIDSNKMVVKLPLHKIVSIKDKSRNIMTKSVITLRELAAYIGTLVSSFPAVQFGPLHYRHLERVKDFGLKRNGGNFDKKVSLNENAKKEISWWNSSLDTAYHKIFHESPDVIIHTDASLLGWGAVVNGTSIGNPWDSSEKKCHINVLELKAVLYGLQYFCDNMYNKSIKIFTDNMTTVAYINNMGGLKSRECDKIACNIWKWAVDNDNWLLAEHVPGSNNTLADKASRVFDTNTEWTLDSKNFKLLIKHLGKQEIDLFASRFNAKLERYVSWKPDAGAYCVNAFSISWKELHFYAFPPFSLLNRCVQKIAQEKAEGIMIVPLWDTQPWYPRVMRMLIKAPLLLPMDTIFHPITRNRHPLKNKLRLMGCLLSGNRTKCEDFRRKLQMLSCNPGDNLRELNTRRMLEDGYVSVVDGKLIPIVMMKQL